MKKLFIILGLVIIVSCGDAQQDAWHALGFWKQYAILALFIYAVRG